MRWKVGPSLATTDQPAEKSSTSRTSGSGLEPGEGRCGKGAGRALKVMLRRLVGQPWVRLLVGDAGRWHTGGVAHTLRLTVNSMSTKSTAQPDPAHPRRSRRPPSQHCRRPSCPAPEQGGGGNRDCSHAWNTMNGICVCHKGFSFFCVQASSNAARRLPDKPCTQARTLTRGTCRVARRPLRLPTG